MGWPLHESFRRFTHIITDISARADSLVRRCTWSAFSKPICVSVVCWVPGFLPVLVQGRGDNFIRKNISEKSPRHSHPSRWARLKVEDCFYGPPAAFPPLSHVELPPSPILSRTHNGGFRKISVKFAFKSFNSLLTKRKVIIRTSLCNQRAIFQFNEISSEIMWVIRTPQPLCR